jgi:hypothetical protein
LEALFLGPFFWGEVEVLGVVWEGGGGEHLRLGGFASGFLWVAEGEGEEEEQQSQFFHVLKIR